LWDYSPSLSLLALLFLSFGVIFYGKNALPIYRQASLPLSCKKQSKASGTN